MTRNHEPFEVGNRHAEKHGAHSARRVIPLARQHEATMLSEKDLGLLRSVARSIADSEARCELLRDHLQRVGLLDGRGRPRAAADFLVRCERLLDSQRTSATKIIAAAIESKRDLASLLVATEEGDQGA